MIYVINTYGYGSFGDDCYFGTLKSSLGEVWPASSIAVNRVDGTPFCPEKQEAAVLGGGGILYKHIDGSGSDPLKYFLRYPAAMQAFGKKTFALSVGIQGPLAAQDLEPYVDVLNAMQLRTVRDCESAGILRQAGVTAGIVESADLSYLMNLPQRSRQEAKHKPVLGIAASQPDKGVIYKESTGFEDRLYSALQQIESDFDIHFYSFDRRTDTAVANGYMGTHEHWVYDSSLPDSVNQFTSAIAKADLFLTSRLHGMTLCASMGIPFVSMGAPGEKVAREARALDHPFHLAYSATASDLIAAVRDAWDIHELLSANLTQAAARQRTLARKTFEALKTCN